MTYPESKYCVPPDKKEAYRSWLKWYKNKWRNTHALRGCFYIFSIKIQKQHYNMYIQN
jgi:hypothetical protein